MAKKQMPKRLQDKLQADIKDMQNADNQSIMLWNPDLKERRLTFEELGKLIHAGKDDIEIIYSGNTHNYWLYSNVLGAYCDMGYPDWKQDEETMEKLVDNGEYLWPLMCWTFGEIEL